MLHQWNIIAGVSDTDGSLCRGLQAKPNILTGVVAGEIADQLCCGKGRLAEYGAVKEKTK